MGRLLRFRGELVLLWRAFFERATPLYLKALMLLVPLYLVSPIDLIPDVIPLAGWLDDLIVIPLLVSWIVGLLPQPIPARAAPRRDAAPRDKVIDGDYRQL